MSCFQLIQSEKDGHCIISSVQSSLTYDEMIENVPSKTELFSLLKHDILRQISFYAGFLYGGLLYGGFLYGIEMDFIDELKKFEEEARYDSNL